MKKTMSLCYRIFFVLFLAVILVILSISGAAIIGLGHIFLSLLSIAAVLGMFCLLMSLPETPHKLLYPAICILLGTLFKLLCLLFLGGDMEMKFDYLTALESAQGVFAEKELIYVHWAVYPRILSLFMKLFGTGYISAVLFNILIAAFSTLLVYLITVVAFKRIKLAFIASLIFALWPSYNFYHLITSNEHLAILFALLSVYFVQLAIQSPDWKRFLFFTAGGITLGLVDFFKQFSIIFFIALAIAAIIWYFLKITSWDWKKIISGVLCFTTLLVVSSVCKTAIFVGLDRYYATPVCRSATAHFIYMGLNSTGNGVWNDTVGFDFPNLVKEYSGDYEKASQELLQTLKEDIKANPKKLFSTIKHKISIDWSADKGVVDWVSWLYKGGAEALPGQGILYTFSSAYYFVVMLLIGVGGFSSFKKRDFFSLLFSLFVFGFALLLLLTEAQGRYQLVLFPWFAILAAYNGSEVYSAFRSINLHQRGVSEVSRQGGK